MDLGPLLNGHAYLRVERPPQLWAAAVDDVALVRVLGEMIATALGRGAELGDVVLRVNNVTVGAGDPSERDGEGDGDDPSGEAAPGDYVALSILGRGDWHPEILWRPEAGAGAVLLNSHLDEAARAAGIPFAYSR